VINADGHAIGVDIGATAVRAAIVSLGRGDGHAAVTMHQVGAVPLTRGVVVDGVVRDQGAVAGALKHLWRVNNLKCRRVVLGIANPQVLVRDMQMPNMPADQRAKALPFRAREIVALPLEQVILDFAPLGAPNPETNLQDGLLVATPHQPVLAAVEAAGVPLQLGFQRRYDAAHRETRRLVEEGKLGRLLFAHSHTRDPAPPPAHIMAASGGVFRDTCVHDFDALRWIVGAEIVEVAAQASVGPATAFTSSGEPDVAAIAVRFANGALGHIDAVRGVLYGYDVRTEVVGTQATAMGGYHRDTPLTVFRPEGVTHDHVYWFQDRFGQAYVEEVRAWVENVLAGRPVTPTGQDGRQALVLALAAEESVRQDGKAIKVQS
jgi:hypothetical protein